jgi:hypothetical protein
MKLECAGFEYLFHKQIPVACAMLDMFFPYYGKDDYKHPDALIHVGKNKNIVDLYRSFFPTKFVGSFCSRFINVNRFKDYGLEKQYDILIYGNRTHMVDFKKESMLRPIEKFIDEYETNTGETVDEDTQLNFYYLRKRLENILVKYADKYRLKILPESGIYNAEVANDSLSMLINQSHITVACTTISDVMMHKYLEIAASKSVILGNVPSDYTDLLSGNMIEVTMFMDESLIIDKIDAALANPEEMNRMANTMYTRVHRDHNFDRAVDNFESVFREISLHSQQKRSS